MNLSKRLTIIAVATLVLFLVGLPCLFPEIDQAEASTAPVNITVLWGTDPAGTDSTGGVVNPPGTVPAGWDSGSSATFTYNSASATPVTFTVTLKTGYSILSATLDSTGITPGGSGLNRTLTFNVPSSNQTLTVKIAPNSANWGVSYNIVDPTTLSWTNPPSGSNGTINDGTSTLDPTQLPSSTSITRGNQIALTFIPDAKYAIQKVEKSTNGGTSWAEVSGTEVSGTNASTGAAATTCNLTSNCVWQFTPTTTTMVRVSYIFYSYYIDTTVGLGGSITPSPDGAGKIWAYRNSDKLVTINHGGSYRVLDTKVVDASAGYATATSVGVVSSYLFQNVSQDGNSINVKYAPAVAPIGQYCQNPSFVTGTTSVLPNIMLILDNSGSMASNAFTGSYLSTKTYFGYFDPTKMYSLSGTVYSVNAAATLDLASSSSGNKLNFSNMTRMDVVKRALTGGWVVDRAAANKVLKLQKASGSTHYTINIGPIEPTGIIQEMADRVRFGMMEFNSSGRGGYVINPIGDSMTSIRDNIDNADPVTVTPLAETYYEAIRYFQHTTGAYNYSASTALTSAGSKANYANYADPILYPCQQSFVLIVTDGQPNENANLPGVTKTSSCNTGTAITDASFDAETWKNKIPTAEWGTVDGSCTKSYLEAVAYYAHNTDLRSDITSLQNLTTYGIYSFGAAGSSPALKAACKYGGFKDTDASGTPNQDSEWKGANGLPSTYFEAGDGDSLSVSLRKAIISMISRVSSGTAASILSNSTGMGANLLQAVFFPTKIFEKETEVKWTGEILNLWYYVDPKIDQSTICEDSDSNNIFNKIDDKIIKFNFDGQLTKVDKFTDTDGTGNNIVSSGSGMTADSISALWRAGKLLWQRDASDRTIYTTLDGLSLTSFTTANKVSLVPYLQAATSAYDSSSDEAGKIISYIRGEAVPSYRTRYATILRSGIAYDATIDSHEWKLGDIVSSTPKIQSGQSLNEYSKKYGDESYTSFINGANYLRRGMVYAGANDGMLHAFKLGKLNKLKGNIEIASVTGSELGKEMWSFIPRNALPYLRYLADNDNYSHIFYVDGTPALNDVSIAKPSDCSETYYWNCSKKTGTGAYRTDGANWKTVLITGMGLGGASRKVGTACNASGMGTADCVKTPITDPADTTNNPGLGYSAYFALDVTGQNFDSTITTLQNNPSLMWEFTHPELGFATAGAAIVRINALTGGSTGTPTKDKNGRWFAVFPSGPTGKIAANQFTGTSDQNLKIFIVDLAARAPWVLNTNYWVKDTGIPFAFGASAANGVSDTDGWNIASNGSYSDDVIYFGYTKREGSAGAYTWTDGGILRLVTNESLNPADWTTSKLIDGIGAVTTSVAKLRDNKNHKFWVYTGTGRFFAGGDDFSTQRQIMGLTDPCYKASGTHGSSSSSPGVAFKDAFDETCTTTITYRSCSALITGDCLVDQSSSHSTTISSSSNGWKITLDPEATSANFGAERLVSDPVALLNGSVFFTTFKPNSNACEFAGKTYMWGVMYNAGATLPWSNNRGKALLQQSTGSFNEMDLSKVLTEKESRRTGDSNVNAQGKPPSDPVPIISNSMNKPLKKILHIQEH